MGSDKTEIWDVKWQRGLGDFSRSQSKGIDNASTIGMYLPWATIFFFP
jgi:hypothetical protein